MEAPPAPAEPAPSLCQRRPQPVPACRWAKASAACGASAVATAKAKATTWLVTALAVGGALALPVVVAATPGTPAQVLPGLRVPGDRLIDLRTGRDTTPEALAAELRQADWVLLGEQHDNPHHHARRGALLASLRGSRAAVVAEHLTLGQRLVPGRAPLVERLAAAGFEPKPWDWPLHEPLFAAIDAAGLPLWGGNLPREQVRRIAREGDAALPADLAALVTAAPLPAAGQARLDDDLRQGHCGQLPEARVPAMRSAQRARDAAMWHALQALQAQGAGGAQPVVLVAGNGHVRLDYAVPRLAAAAAPGQRGLAVGFGELGDSAEGPYAVLWLTPPATRADPCAGLVMPSTPLRPAVGAAGGTGPAASAAR